MAQYVVAVSGGVDSVVLLDMLARGELKTDDDELIVAHFDHGIRAESAADAKFVRGLAEHYGLPFETKREELGAGASEELARERRYAFLRDVAKRHDGRIVTAHHADDVVETIAINLTRGTGWRGLAVLDSPDIERPLLDRTKQELQTYAKEHGLLWHEDATNADTTYLRNDLRQRLAGLDSETHRLLRLYRDRQVFIRKEIDNETKRIVRPSPYARYLFIMAPEPAAIELLRRVFVRETGVSPTRPQLATALLAIKTYKQGKRYEVAGGVSLRFTVTDFVVLDAFKVLS